MPVTHEFIVVEIGAGVMTITLNRPDVLNSFNAQMARELRGALEDARADKTVRAVLLTGAGRAFCAGQDLSDVPMSAEGEPLDISSMVRATYNPVIKAIRKLELPVVCAVNGVAAGAGANLAFACDIVIAAKSASFIASMMRGDGLARPIDWEKSDGSNGWIIWNASAPHSRAAVRKAAG